MDNKDVIITGSLDYSEIDKSITDLVRKIETNTRKVADSYDGTVEKIEKGMKGITSAQSSVISGIEAEIAASKKLTEAIDKLNKTREKGKKTESKSMNEVLGMPIDTEKAINAKLKALEKLRKTTPISTEGYETIKKEYTKLSNLRKELLKTEERLNREAAAAEKKRLKEEEQLKREIAKEEKERKREQERLNREAAAAEKERLREIKQKEKEITAEQKKRNASQKVRAKNIADKTLNMHERSVSEMEEKIRQIRKHQEWLNNRGLLSQAKVGQMTRAVDRLQAKIEKLQKSNSTTGVLNKKEVFSMPETTIAEISAKMKAIGAIRENATIGSRELDKLNNEYNRLNIAQKKALSSGVKLENQNNRLIKTFKNLSERVLFYLSLGALTGFTRNLLKIRGEYEMLERSIGILVNDMDRGSQVFRTLQDKAKESPFTLVELGTATKQLAAYDFQAKDLVDTTNRLADISAALNVPIERLVYNLGQIKAQNVLNARDARDFANAGLAIVPMLAKMYSEQEKQLVTAADVYDRMKKKMVSYADVLSVINGITDEGGKFYNFQAKQAETLKVRIANLSLAYNDMLNDMGKNGSWLINFVVDGTKDLFENWKTIANILKNILFTLGSYKAYQLVINRLTDAQGVILDKNGGKLSKMNVAAKMLSIRFRRMMVSLRSFVTSPATLFSAGVMMLWDIYSNYKEAAQKIEDISKDLLDKAKKNYDDIRKFEKNNFDNIFASSINKLSVAESEKLWEGFKELIKETTSESEKLIATLEGIDDINKRLTRTREIVDSIKEAERIISLHADEISYDTGDWFNLGSMEEKLKNLGKAKKNYDKLIEDKFNGSINDWRFNIGKSDFETYLKGAEKKTYEFSQSIANIIKEGGNKDINTINEILARVKESFLKNHEEIRGDAATLFNIIVDEQVKALLNTDKNWKGILTTNESLMDAFTEKLRKHKEVISAIKKGQLDAASSYKQLPEDAKEAFEKTLNEFIIGLPNYSQQIRDMVNGLNWENLKIKIGVVFNIKKPTEAQEIFDNMIDNMKFPSLDLKRLRPNEGEDNIEYEKRIQQTWKADKEQLRLWKRQNKQGIATKEKWNNKIQDLENKILAEEEIAYQYGFPLEEEKKKKSGGTAKKEESVLSRAIKTEIKLINDLSTSYEKLNKAGVQRGKSIEMLSELYKKQIDFINIILGKNKLPQFDINKFVGTDLTAQKKYLDDLLSTMKSLGLDKKDMAAFKQVGEKLTNMTVTSAVDNETKIAKIIKQEQDKVNKELKFSKEISKDDEMRKFFDFIGIRYTDLPKTAEDVLSKMEEVLKDKGINDFNILATNIDQYAEENDFDKESERYKMLKDLQENIRSLYKEEFVQRINNLKEYIDKYGTAEEQIYQITKHYNNLIANENDFLKKRSLNKEKEIKINEANMRTISKGIDWNVAMPELGGIISKVAKKVLKDVNTYMNSSQFRGLSIDKQKSWYDLKNQLNKTTGGNTTSPFNFAIWGKIADQMKDWEKAIQEVTNAEERHKNALEQQKKAETDIEKQTAEAMVYITEEGVKTAQGKAKKAQQDLTTSSEKATNGITGFTNAINEITNGSLYGLANGFSKLITQLTKKGGVAESLSELGGKIGGIVGAVLQILDALGSKSREVIDDMFNNIIIALEGIIRDLPMILADIIVKDIPRIIGAALDGVGHWFGVDFEGLFNNGNAKKVNKIIEELTKSNERLSKAIDYLSEIIGNSAGAQAIYASEKAIEAQLRINKNTQEIWLAKMGYHNSHHSNASKFNNDLFSQWEQDIKEALKAAGLDERSIKNWADVQTLSAEEMAAIRAFAPEAFKYLEEVGKYDMSKELNEYADLAGELEKLENKIKENLAQISFDSLRDSFLSTLSDIESDTKDFAEKINDILRQAIVNRWVLTDDVQKELNKLYEEYVDAIGRKDLQGAKDAADKFKKREEELKNETNEYFKVIGLDKKEQGLDLSALQQGIQSITEETGGAIEAYLNGISAQVYLHNDKLQELITLTEVNTGSNSEIIQIMKNSLESINVIKNTILDCLSSNSRAIKVEMIN